MTPSIPFFRDFCVNLFSKDDDILKDGSQYLSYRNKISIDSRITPTNLIQAYPTYVTIEYLDNKIKRFSSSVGSSTFYSDMMKTLFVKFNVDGKVEIDQIVPDNLGIITKLKTSAIFQKLIEDFRKSLRKLLQYDDVLNYSLENSNLQELILSLNFDALTASDIETINEFDLSSHLKILLDYILNIFYFLKNTQHGDIKFKKWEILKNDELFNELNIIMVKKIIAFFKQINEIIIFIKNDNQDSQPITNEEEKCLKLIINYNPLEKKYYLPQKDDILKTVIGYMILQIQKSIIQINKSNIEQTIINFKEKSFKDLTQYELSNYLTLVTNFEEVLSIIKISLRSKMNMETIKVFIIDIDTLPSLDKSFELFIDSNLKAITVLINIKSFKLDDFTLPILSQAIDDQTLNEIDRAKAYWIKKIDIPISSEKCLIEIEDRDSYSSMKFNLCLEKILRNFKIKYKDLNVSEKFDFKLLNVKTLEAIPLAYQYSGNEKEFEVKINHNIEYGKYLLIVIVNGKFNLKPLFFNIIKKEEKNANYEINSMKEYYSLIGRGNAPIEFYIHRKSHFNNDKLEDYNRYCKNIFENIECKIIMNYGSTISLINAAHRFFLCKMGRSKFLLRPLVSLKTKWITEDICKIQMTAHEFGVLKSHSIYDMQLNLTINSMRLKERSKKFIKLLCLMQHNSIKLPIPIDFPLSNSLIFIFYK